MIDTIPLDFKRLPEEEMLQISSEFYKNLNRRRTVRDFSDEEVPEQVILNPQQLPSPVKLSPYRAMGKVESSNARPPSGIKGGSKRRQHHQSQQHQSSHSSSHPPSSSLPPSGMQRGRGRTSSQEQASDSPPPTSSRRKRHSKSRNYGSVSSDTTPPPPPPPLPPNSQFHIRADSVGSVSSLGSFGIGSREFEDDDFSDIPSKSKNGGENSRKASRRSSGGGHNRSDSASSGFFDMIRQQWSPNPKSPPSVSEFHKKNQKFLHQSAEKKERTSGRPSPKTQHRR